MNTVQTYHPRDIPKAARRKREADRLRQDCAGGLSITASLSMGALQGGIVMPPYPTTDLYLGLIAHSDNFALSGGKITTWQGVGSSGLSASQGTGPLQPSPGTGINGRTSVEFAGGQILSVPGVTLTYSDIYVVIKTSTTGRIIIEHSTSATGTGTGRYLATSSTGSAAIVGYGSFSSCDVSAAWCTDGIATLIRHGHNGTHAQRILQRDGANVSLAAAAYSSNLPGLSATHDFFIGARSGPSSGFIGSIGAILIYTAAPDPTRAAEVLAWSKAYWGTP